MNKKIKIGILSAVMVALPIATVISCGKQTETKTAKPKNSKGGTTSSNTGTNKNPEVKKPKIVKPINKGAVVQSVTITNLYNILNIEVLKADKRESILKYWPKRDVHFDAIKNKEIFNKDNEKFILDISYPPKFIWSGVLKKHMEGKVINKTITLDKEEFMALSVYFTKLNESAAIKGDQKLPEVIKHDRTELVDIINKIKHPRNARNWKAVV